MKLSSGLVRGGWFQNPVPVLTRLIIRLRGELFHSCVTQGNLILVSLVFGRREAESWRFLGLGGALLCRARREVSQEDKEVEGERDPSGSGKAPVCPGPSPGRQ